MVLNISKEYLSTFKRHYRPNFTMRSCHDVLLPFLVLSVDPSLNFFISLYRSVNDQRKEGQITLSMGVSKDVPPGVPSRKKMNLVSVKYYYLWPWWLQS